MLPPSSEPSELKRHHFLLLTGIVDKFLRPGYQRLYTAELVDDDNDEYMTLSPLHHNLALARQAWDAVCRSELGEFDDYIKSHCDQLRHCNAGPDYFYFLNSWDMYFSYQHAGSGDHAHELSTAVPGAQYGTPTYVDEFGRPTYTPSAAEAAPNRQTPNAFHHSELVPFAEEHLSDRHVSSDNESDAFQAGEAERSAIHEEFLMPAQRLLAPYGPAFVMTAEDIKRQILYGLYDGSRTVSTATVMTPLVTPTPVHPIDITTLVGRTTMHCPGEGGVLIKGPAGPSMEAKHGETKEDKGEGPSARPCGGYGSNTEVFERLSTWSWPKIEEETQEGAV